MKKSYLIIFLSVMIMTTLNTLTGCAGTSGRHGGLLPAVKFAELIETVREVKLVDIRTADEYAEGHIPGAINIDFYSKNFTENIKSQFSEGSDLAIYCRSGRRSAEAADALVKAGYNITDLEGGILEWEKALLPITTGATDKYFTNSGKMVEIEPLIHASIRICYDGKEIEIDPVGKLGDRTTDYSQFPKADLILVTHEHHDHLDPEAIKTLENKDTVVIANPNSAAILGYGNMMKNGDVKTVDGIEIKAVPAYNVSPDKLQFHPKGRDNGYVLNLDGIRIYIAGDTEPIPEMKELGDIDIAFLPCNLPYTMTPQQLIEAAETIKPKVLYPYHFGTTDLSSVTPALAPEGIYVRICPFDP